ncbi:MAG: hypothetical protein H7841_15890 [Magnetospirillum sp. WYHS-4]
MDRLTRRSRLSVRPDPDPKLDYLVTLEGEIGGERPAAIELRYVPDRLILVPESFAAYLEDLGRRDWESLESLAVALLDDLRNELVARWLQVALQGSGHAVLVEDRQPKWDNPRLLARLRQH